VLDKWFEAVYTFTRCLERDSKDASENKGL